MKKIICSLLVIALMSVLLAPAVFAAGTSVAVTDITAEPGDEVTVDVTITGNTGFGSATFDIVYDSSVLTLTAIGVDNTLFGKGVGVQNVAKNRVNCASTVNITGDGVLFTLTFKVADNAAGGSYDVSVVAKTFTDDKGAKITATVTEGTVDVHVCEWTWVIDTEATCGKDGAKHEECTCGEKRNEGTKIPATGNHTWTWVTDTEATCGKDGAKHEECTCGAKRNEGTKIPATGEHAWKWVTDTEATCGKDGAKHEECTCGAKRNEGTKIPATGNHTWTWVTDTEPTCGKDGAKHEECTCGTKRNEGTKIPATGKHDWEWVVDKEATADEEGEKHEECKNCGAKQNEGTKIPMIDDVPPMGDNFAIYVVFSLVALVSLAGVYFVSKKKNI